MSSRGQDTVSPIGLPEAGTDSANATRTDAMAGDAMGRLVAAGQSVWLDSIDRPLIASGELARLIANRHLAGLTSNPAIFQKAMAGAAYRADMARLRQSGASAIAVYEALAIADVQAAADLFRPLYEQTGGRDGLVSLEVSPVLAHDAPGTVVEARRLWAALDRPNVMIKVPGTPAGVAAIEALLADGINVNVTLLFARDAFEAVAEAHACALEQRLAAGQSVERIASVASFFISRIDTHVDAELERVALAAPVAGIDRETILALRGKTAIANARLAYADALARQALPRWGRLAAAGARPQRLLWASTSCKNPAYRDVVYVESLVGADTVNTLPPTTLAAFADHGVVSDTLPGNLFEARHTLAMLHALGVDLDRVTSQLLSDGLQQFADAFAALIGAVEKAG